LPFGQGGFAPIPPQTWYGYPAGQPGALNNPILQLVAQQIPQLVQNAHQIAQQAPQLVQQIPQLIQQNPQLLQQAPQLQQVPQLLQQAATLAQQIPQVLQALCASPHHQGVAGGAGPFFGNAGGLRPLGFGQTVFS
jgi:small-conductance mechanosensitive channel